MIIERELIISLLKLTKKGSVLVKSIKNEARIPFDIIMKLLEKLQDEGTITFGDGIIEIDSNNRLKLAIRAASLGADIERVSAFFNWKEFENVAAIALERHGYVVSRNVRFKSSGRRWEIDVVGCKKPIVLCVDCKHWKHGLKFSAIKRIVKAQMDRTRALVGMLPSNVPKLECMKWKKANFIPVILSLFPSSSKFYENVPIVSILQLQNFLAQVPAQVDSLTYFFKEFSHL
jgi:Holliday junction resolvase-like predicted endonuclease